MATATMKAPAKAQISAKQYENALKRYAANVRASKVIIDKSETAMNKEMEKRHLALGSMPRQMEEDAAIIGQYCEDNKETMFSIARTIDTPYGKLGFKTGQYAVRYPEDADEKQINKDLIAAFKKKALTLYVVTSETLDKKKMITDRDDKNLKKVLDSLDVEISQGESFFITIN